MKTILFIHRSVGRNLIDDGQLREQLTAIGCALDDYDHNNHVLTSAAGEQTNLGETFSMPDTTPADYAALFSRSGRDEQIKAHELIAGYDMVVIKSCYPNSQITNDEQLVTIKEHYTNIAKFFLERKQQQLVVMTNPPLRKSRTDAASAGRARQLNDWLSSIGFGQNISVFNFFTLLADPNKNTLRRDYQRLTPLDSHPNKQASQDIAPLLVAHIQSQLQ